jgi:hypothetical protein
MIYHNLAKIKNFLHSILKFKELLIMAFWFLYVSMPQFFLQLSYSLPLVDDLPVQSLSSAAISKYLKVRNAKFSHETFVFTRFALI